MEYSLFGVLWSKAFNVAAMRQAVGVATWAYTIAVVSLWLLLRTAGDRWWFATVLLYSPRWLCGLPLLLLVPASLLFNRRAMWRLIVAFTICLVPIMGLRVPLAYAHSPDVPRVRVLTCNVQGGEAARDALAAMICNEQPDLVALQEASSDVAFQWPEGWHVHREGQIIIASRYSISEVSFSLRIHPHSRWPPINAVRCVVRLPRSEIGFCCVHLQTPREGLEQVLDRETAVAPKRSWMLRQEIEFRRWESEELHSWLGRFDKPTVIAGDFNMPVDSNIFHTYWSHYANAFSVAGFGFGNTKVSTKRGWTYGARIDHILFDPAYFACQHCWVAADVGSDHRPLVAELLINP